MFEKIKNFLFPERERLFPIQEYIVNAVTNEHAPKFQKLVVEHRNCGVTTALLHAAVKLAKKGKMVGFICISGQQKKFFERKYSKHENIMFFYPGDYTSFRGCSFDTVISDDIDVMKYENKGYIFILYNVDKYILVGHREFISI